MPVSFSLGGLLLHKYTFLMGYYYLSMAGSLWVPVWVYLSFCVSYYEYFVLVPGYFVCCCVCVPVLLCDSTCVCMCILLHAWVRHHAEVLE